MASPLAATEGLVLCGRAQIITRFSEPPGQGKRALRERPDDRQTGGNNRGRLVFFREILRLLNSRYGDH